MQPMAKPFEPLTLATDRLDLRFIDEGDTDAVLAMCSQPEVMRYTPRPAMKERVEAEQMIERIRSGYAQGTTLQLGIVRREDGRYLGHCVLFNFHAESRRAEIGYSLDKRFWGQGFMNEALQAFIDYAFDGLGLNRLEADIDPRNIASARSLARLGFAHEGLLRERWIVGGEVSDTGMYGLLRSDWKR
jgi:[ribosomal protein S5]-alanine N-acetyltransferase